MENDDWDISYDIDDLIEPQNKKKNMFAKTFNEITPVFGDDISKSKSNKEIYDSVKNPKFESHVELMTADEYFTASQLRNADINKNTVWGLTPRQRIDLYKQDAKRGDKFPMPYLRYDDDGEYLNQDGFHRTFMANELGMNKIPVMKITTRKEPYKESNFKKRQNPFTFDQELI